MLLLRWWDHSDTFSFHFPRLPGLKGIFAGISDKNGGLCMLECLLSSLYSHKLPTFLQRHKTLCSKSHRAKRVSEKTWKGCYCIPSLRLQSYFHKMAHMWTLVCASVRQRVSLYKCNVKYWDQYHEKSKWIRNKSSYFRVKLKRIKFGL